MPNPQSVKMFTGGYYLKARRIFQSEVEHKPPHFRETWDWLLMSANFQDRENLKRGQLVTSYVDIAESLHWKVGGRKMRYSKCQVEKALRYFRLAGMITSHTTGRRVIITITNYNKYQNPATYIENPESDGCGDSKTTPKAIHLPTEKQSRKRFKNNPESDGCGDSITEERIKNNICTCANDESFTRFWDAYPKKVNKVGARKKFDAIFKKLTPEKSDQLLTTILNALVNQKRSEQWQKDYGQYIPHPTTWLNNQRWNDKIKLTESDRKAQENDEILKNWGKQ